MNLNKFLELATQFYIFQTIIFYAQVAFESKKKMSWVMWWLAQEFKLIKALILKKTKEVSNFD